MKILLHSIIIVTLLCGFVSAFSQPGEVPYYQYQIKKLTDSVYVFNRPIPFRIVQGNVTVILTKDDVIVVDAGGSPSAAKLIIDEIKKLTKNPVRILINTHWHGDHTFGNQEFVRAYPGIEIISSKFTRDYFVSPGLQYPFNFIKEENFQQNLEVLRQLYKKEEETKLPGYEKVLANLDQKIKYDYQAVREEYSAITITMPTTVCEKEMTLYRGGREIKLLDLGFGDTAGDLWVYLPKEKILITGDAVVHPIPYGFSSDPLTWIETLKRATTLDFDIMIPGHGDVQHSKTYIKQLTSLLEVVQSRVKAGLDKGQSLDEIKAQVDFADQIKLFTAGDPVLRFYFDLYFIQPAIPQMFNVLKK
jgi:cyclase